MAELTSRRRACIHAIRDYFPEKIVTNKDMEKIVETTDDWIRERTGIRERRMSAPHETPAYMGSEAAKKLFQDLKVDPLSIDLILCATITADYQFPSAACLIQASLGCKRAWAYDINAACSGYLYALETARAYVESGLGKKVLVIAAEKMSSILDYSDRATCIIFGDGGSATLVTEASDSESYFVDAVLRADGSGREFLYMPAGGSIQPPSEQSVRERGHFVKQDGKNVFKRAVVDMAAICEEVLTKNKLTPNDIELFVPHQANMRIIESVSQRLGVSLEKTAINIDRFANTTAATIPTALVDAQRKGQLKKGMLCLLASFGAGFTWGATLIRI